ncbi:hypothetical protein QQF64_000144 [Cirrhinus molitorella]|uniref:Uncharacterized protein n=1 Tax=Cirrhinus molitorella TaxID=172907 RepID=A0ABR3NX41_9TELE
MFWPEPKEPLNCHDIPERAWVKASVNGEVVDHRNGTYSVAFLLPWEGQAQVFVRLEHSSEVVQIIKKYTESSFSRTHFNGYFGSGPSKSRIREVVERNLKWGEDGSWKKGNCCCEYKDIRSGTENSRLSHCHAIHADFRCTSLQVKTMCITTGLFSLDIILFGSVGTEWRDPHQTIPAPRT